MKATDCRVRGVAVYCLPVQTRMPLKFGAETLTSVVCLRVKVRVEDRRGRSAEGWGETPLSVQWVWPSATPYAARFEALQQFALHLADAWSAYEEYGHPVELGAGFQEAVLRPAWKASSIPWLAALLGCSPYDLAIHDAYGMLHRRPVYATYGGDWMTHDLARWLQPSSGEVRFEGRFPGDFLRAAPRRTMPAWHLVGGLDPIDPKALSGTEPRDGHPVLLRDWIRRDGLTCLKIKLRGNDPAWDYARLADIGRLGREEGVKWLSADFNCTVQSPEYVREILDRLEREEAETHRQILYVEQPFPYALEELAIDVREIARRKPLFLDESAHDWTQVRLGRELGWNGVALKTCKTQTGALLSACWAMAHGMSLMVQDLTNPMLAQISHLQLAAHLDTLMGVETNSMQFYPEASRPEAGVHPGMFTRREGCVDLSTAGSTGLGYRAGEIPRDLPPPVRVAGRMEA